MLGEKEEDEALIPQEEEAEEGEEPLDSENMDKVRAFKQRSMLSDLAEGGDEMEEEEEEGRKRNRGTGHMRKRRRARDLRWLIDRMSRLARYEAGHRPKEAIKVCMVMHHLHLIHFYFSPFFFLAYSCIAMDSCCFYGPWKCSPPLSPPCSPSSSSEGALRHQPNRWQGAAPLGAGGGGDIEAGV